MEHTARNISPLSVIIITSNEAANIERCLQALQGWVAEIIILDSGSKDNTVELARRFTDKVIQTADWPGYGAQKQRALTYATQDWVLSLDADEVLSQDLAQEIQSVLSQSCPFDGFALRFQSYYLNQAIYYGDWRAETHVRLFRRDKTHIVPRQVHCRIEVAGKLGRLKGLVHHYSYPNLETVLKKVDLYSSLGARQKQLEGARGGLAQALLHGLWSFFRAYFLRRGFMDGKLGFMLAISNAECSYYRYLKLMQLCQSDKAS